MSYAHSPALATLTTPDTTATIVAASGDTVVLWWTDNAANEWSETHTDLATALARLAVLQHCITHTEGFAHTDPHDFASAAAPFLDRSTTMPAARSPTWSAWRRAVTRP
ncbi:hypothetical protein DFR67_1168 [Williamsia limnetica]|uniref:Uncharacterized protein n=1 Tax=Williamsia limnetica TaxID=882452 RepID=A0A318RGH8_WILLI|nr:hypothetical protein [Williamsia limnetica]PYE13454.1 hypothetical protein DFR67_1168 [Williamsia limnetica]